jgi:hypothetical protein
MDFLLRKDDAPVRALTYAQGQTFQRASMLSEAWVSMCHRWTGARASIWWGGGVLLWVRGGLRHNKSGSLCSATLQRQGSWRMTLLSWRGGCWGAAPRTPSGWRHAKACLGAVLCSEGALVEAGQLQEEVLAAFREFLGPGQNCLPAG